MFKVAEKEEEAPLKEVSSSPELTPSTLEPHAHSPQPHLAPFNDPFEKEANQTALSAVGKKFEMKNFSGFSVSENKPQSSNLSSDLGQTLDKMLGKGKSIDHSTKNVMENYFHKDIGHVRFHDNSTSHRLNHDLNSQAFTYGGDIFFRQDGYQPQSPFGHYLLTHELTHSLQQRANVVPSKTIQRMPYLFPDDPLKDLTFYKKDQFETERDKMLYQTKHRYRLVDRLYLELIESFDYNRTKALHYLLQTRNYFPNLYPNRKEVDSKLAVMLLVSMSDKENISVFSNPKLMSQLVKIIPQDTLKYLVMTTEGYPKSPPPNPLGHHWLEPKLIHSLQLIANDAQVDRLLHVWSGTTSNYRLVDRIYLQIIEHYNYNRLHALYHLLSAYNLYSDLYPNRKEIDLRLATWFLNDMSYKEKMSVFSNPHLIGALAHIIPPNTLRSFYVATVKSGPEKSIDWGTFSAKMLTILFVSLGVGYATGGLLSPWIPKAIAGLGITSPLGVGVASTAGNVVTGGVVGLTTGISSEIAAQKLFHPGKDIDWRRVKASGIGSTVSGSILGFVPGARMGKSMYRSLKELPRGTRINKEILQASFRSNNFLAGNTSLASHLGSMFVTGGIGSGIDYSVMQYVLGEKIDLTTLLGMSVAGGLLSTTVGGGGYALKRYFLDNRISKSHLEFIESPIPKLTEQTSKELKVFYKNPAPIVGERALRDIDYLLLLLKNSDNTGTPMFSSKLKNDDLEKIIPFLKMHRERVQGTLAHMLTDVMTKDLKIFYKNPTPIVGERVLKDIDDLLLLLMNTDSKGMLMSAFPNATRKTDVGRFKNLLVKHRKRVYAMLKSTNPVEFKDLKSLNELNQLTQSFPGIGLAKSQNFQSVDNLIKASQPFAGVGLHPDRTMSSGNYVVEINRIFHDLNRSLQQDEFIKIKSKRHSPDDGFLKIAYWDRYFGGNWALTSLKYPDVVKGIVKKIEGDLKILANTKELSEPHNFSKMISDIEAKNIAEIKKQFKNLLYVNNKPMNENQIKSMTDELYTLLDSGNKFKLMHTYMELYRAGVKYKLENDRVQTLSKERKVNLLFQNAPEIEILYRYREVLRKNNLDAGPQEKKVIKTFFNNVNAYLNSGSNKKLPNIDNIKNKYSENKKIQDLLETNEFTEIQKILNTLAVIRENTSDKIKAEQLDLIKGEYKEWLNSNLKNVTKKYGLEYPNFKNQVRDEGRDLVAKLRIHMAQSHPFHAEDLSTNRALIEKLSALGRTKDSATDQDFWKFILDVRYLKTDGEKTARGDPFYFCPRCRELLHDVLMTRQLKKAVIFDWLHSVGKEGKNLRR